MRQTYDSQNLVGYAGTYTAKRKRRSSIYTSAPPPISVDVGALTKLGSIRCYNISAIGSKSKRRQ
nr:hypothetical protein P5645_09410 [Bacillus subtilis]